MHMFKILKTGWGLLLLSLFCSIPLVSQAQSDADIAAAVRNCQAVEALSARLSCYDRAFPPLAETFDPPGSVTPEFNPPARAEKTEVTQAPRSTNNASLPSREELAETVVELEQRLQRETADGSTLRIIEVEKPSLRSSRLVSSDGRVFLQTNSRTVTRWPEPPFDIEVSIGMMGAIYLLLPGSNDRIRVMLEE